jgi:hypothetical protein
MAKPDVFVIPSFLTVAARILLFIFISVWTMPCMAEDSDPQIHLQRHPAYIEPSQLMELEASGLPKVMISKNQSGALIVDASAVFIVNLDAFIGASLDFDHYAQFGAPHIVRSRVIIPGGDHTPMIIWNRMRYGIVTSSQYQTVIAYKNPLTSGFAGSCWQLHHPEKQLPDFPDSTIFDQFDGSWYIEPFEKNPDGENRLTKVYVRYFLKIQYRWWVPSFIINYFSTETGALEQDVVNFLLIFKRLSS